MVGKISNDPTLENKGLQVGVKALLRNKSGKYLLLRDSMKKYPEKESVWDMVGGRINDFKSNLLDNLRREVREETGLELKGKPRLVGAQDIKDVKEYPGRYVVRLTYIVDAMGELQIDLEEVETYGWFTLEEIQKLPNLGPHLRELFDEGLITE